MYNKGQKIEIYGTIVIFIKVKIYLSQNISEINKYIAKRNLISIVYL